MTNQHTPDTREEAASKLPALHVLMVMGWTYLPPTEALVMRGSERSVLLARTSHPMGFGQRFC